MHLSHRRLICRANNRFTPSVALWQHFVVANFSFVPQRYHASSATEAVLTPLEQDGRPSSPQQAGSGSSDLGPDTTETPTETPKLTIRKLTTTKGHWHSSKAKAAIAKSKRVQYDTRQTSLTQTGKILAVTKAAFEIGEDYEGVAIKPMIPAQPVKENKLPWRLEREETISSGTERLAVEIERFYEFAKPDRFENIARKHVIEQVRNHVRQTLPDHVLEVFGSERTGIPLAVSDVDFRLIRRSSLADPATAKLPPSPPERAKAIHDLQNLYWKTLKTHKAYLLPQLLHARYPLISLQDRQSGLDLQIVLSNDTTVSRVIMQDYMEQYPYLRKLYYVVKTVFDIRGLSDVFRGGFGSYSIFMMIVASIRHDPHPRNDAVGGLLNFLKFWRDFDTSRHIVSIEPVELLDKESEMIMTPKTKAKLEDGRARPLPAYMLSLRDPADETNDLGRKGIAIKHVQMTFRSLFQQLEYDLKVNTRPSILGPLVGHSYMLNYTRRAKLHQYGQRVMNQMQSTLAAKAKSVREAEYKEQIDSETQSETKQGASPVLGTPATEKVAKESERNAADE